MAILSNGKFYGFLCSVKETGQKLANGVKEYVEDFVSGFAGHGWKLWEYVTGKWKLEIDTIVVRETMLVFEMLISKVRAIIGAQAITQGHGKVKLARISDDYTEYLIVLEDEEMSIMAHDFVRCQTFTGDKTKFYHVEVFSVDVETKTLHVPLSEFEQDESGNVLYPPIPGDELVQFGNSQNKARQSAIYLHADETGQPAIDVMFDIDSKNWDSKVKVRVGGDIPDSGGLKGFYCENGMIKGADSNGHTVYCIYPDGTAEFGDGSAMFCTDKSGHIAGGAISWIWNAEKKKCVCTMKDVVLTWDNLSDEAKENLKGEPGADGKDGMRVYITYNDSEEEPVKPMDDGTTEGWHTNLTASVIWISQKVAESLSTGEWGTPIRFKGKDGKPGQDTNLLPWIEEWNNNKTQIGSEYIVSPKLFTGKNTGTAERPILTGIALGTDCLIVNGKKKSGFYGIKENTIIFSIDAETANIDTIGDVIANAIKATGLNINDNFIVNNDGTVSITGMFTSNKDGNRIIIDPVDKKIKIYNSNGQLLSIYGFDGGFPQLALFTYKGDSDILFSSTRINSNGIDVTSLDSYDNNTRISIAPIGIHFYKNGNLVKTYAGV